jgi:DNA-binding IclR family transcriptional regulator
MSQTLDRALRILDVLAEKPRRINEIALFLGVHNSTALRLLHTLRRRGFVHELPDHQYRLGSATFRLAFQALDSIDLRSVARPYMEVLNDKSGETIHLGTLVDRDVVYIEKVEARRPVLMSSRIGALAPLHSTSLAKAILAFMPTPRRAELLKARKLTRYTDCTLTTVTALAADLAKTRERGYALNDQETEDGIRSIAAPVFAGDDEVAGSISMSVAVMRMDLRTLVGFVPDLTAAAEATSRELGWHPR